MSDLQRFIPLRADQQVQVGDIVGSGGSYVFVAIRDFKVHNIVGYDGPNIVPSSYFFGYLLDHQFIIAVLDFRLIADDAKKLKKIEAGEFAAKESDLSKLIKTISFIEASAVLSVEAQDGSIHQVDLSSLKNPEVVVTDIEFDAQKSELIVTKQP